MDNNLIVFLNRKSVSSVDFSDKDMLEDYFKKLFLKLSDDFSIEIFGSFDIEVFNDKFYGSIIVIRKNDDYFDYCDIVDMKISVSKFSGFLYKVDDFICFDNCNVYSCNGCFYLDPLSADFYDVGVLFECCDIIYGKDVYDIKMLGTKVNNCLFID